MPGTARFLRLRKGLTIVLVNLVATCVLVEALALVVYWARTGELYYTGTFRRALLKPDLEKLVEGHRIHPYLGFVRLPGSPSRPLPVNNYGFESRVDYPYRRRSPEEVVVGLFGGSVAANLAAFESLEHVLALELGAALGLQPGRVTILCFAQGGYKQPQQLLALTYFQALGQELDLVVNLDGFNEVTLASRNAASGVAVAMPSVAHMRGLQDVTAMARSGDAVEELLRVRSAWARFSSWHNRAWSRRGWELGCATGFLVDYLVYSHHYRTFLDRRQAYGAGLDSKVVSSWLYLNPRLPVSDQPQAMAEAVALWSRCSALMRRETEAAGGKYLHLLQPNQYYPTRRAFTAAERTNAISPRSAFAPYVVAGYPLLEAEIPRLASSGVAAASLTRLFDDVPETIYSDDCCHYNERGQRLLATAVAELAAAELRKAQ